MMNAKKVRAGSEPSLVHAIVHNPDANAGAPTGSDRTSTGSVPSAKLREVALVRAGRDFLSLRYIHISDSCSDGGWDFLELVWFVREGDATLRRATISAARFQEGHPFRREVINLHSLDPVKMSAIVQVAEADHPTHEGFKMSYSWRSLSLRGDVATTLLKGCARPTDRFE